MILFLAFFLAAAPLFVSAQSTPSGSSASDVMTKVEAAAGAQHKAVFLSFGASWCGNCHLLNHFVNDPAIFPILSKAFVFSEIITGERPNDPKHANLPGGLQLQNSLGGKEAGWPYFVIVDSHGKLLASSVAPGKVGNIGYPVTPDEIAWFGTMLQKAAPSLTSQDLATVKSWLEAHRPKSASAQS